MVMKGIYRLSWLNNAYFYIGQSSKLKERFAKHLVRLRSGKHENNKIQNIYKKYGEPIFDILLTTEDLDKEEQALLDIHFSDEYCCNLCPTANSTKGYRHTEDAKRRIGELSKKKVYNEQYRKRLRERKPNINMLGKKHTESAKLKMSISRKEVIKSKEHRAKIGDANRGVKHYNFGGTLTIETKNKLSEALSLANNPKAKPVIDKETNITYGCAKEVSNLFGLNYSTLRNHLQKLKSKRFEYVVAQPANVRKVFLSASGAISNNKGLNIWK